VPERVSDREMPRGLIYGLIRTPSPTDLRKNRRKENADTGECVFPIHCNLSWRFRFPQGEAEESRWPLKARKGEIWARKRSKLPIEDRVRLRIFNSGNFICLGTGTSYVDAVAGGASHHFEHARHSIGFILGCDDDAQVFIGNERRR